MFYDYVIIGTGIYGLYSADLVSNLYKNKRILVLERDKKPFSRASYVNQARLHNGYHYPRSLHTAVKCSNYFDKFISDYSFAIVSDYKKIYAISSKFGMSTPDNFERFCENANIPYKRINELDFFNRNMVEACYETKEYTIDMIKIRDYYLKKLTSLGNIRFSYGDYIEHVNKKDGKWILHLHSKNIIESRFVFNATYASLNSVIKLFNFDTIPIKFELAEMILCRASESLKKYGITVMDGPFFSIMPFNHEGLYSLSAVRYTPHEFSNETFPNFSCQKKSPSCSGELLDNCNYCKYRSKSAWPHMYQLVKKYLKVEFIPIFEESIFTIKALMQSSATSDSRPVVIQKYSDDPTFISVLGGKVNTIYEINEVFL